MTKSILTVSSWRLLAAFVGGVIAAEIVARLTATYFDWNREYGPYPTLRYSLILLAFWTYPYLVGSLLKGRARRQMLLIGFLAILNNTISVYINEQRGFAWTVVFMTALVNFFCMLTIPAIPAREIKSLELKRRASFAEYWQWVIQFMFWPFFVWRIQSTLVSIVNQKANTKEAKC